MGCPLKTRCCARCNCTTRWRTHWQSKPPSPCTGTTGAMFRRMRSGFWPIFSSSHWSRNGKALKKKNVLVVCSSGGASSRLIAYRFEEEFSKYLDHIEVCDVFHLDGYDFSRIDYIFSTVPIHQKVNVPIIRVEDFLNQSSMRVVQGILEGSSADFLSAYYQPELFFLSCGRLYQGRSDL